MPAKPSWYHQLDDIISQLEAFPAPLVDRSSVEKLFGVRRRRALQLMQNLGGYQIGRTCLVNRHEMIEALERVRGSEPYVYERRRKQRLEEAMEAARREARARKIRIAAPSGNPEKPAGLPDGVTLGHGELRICYRSYEECLERLFALARTIADDFEGFQRLANRT